MTDFSALDNPQANLEEDEATLDISVLDEVSPESPQRGARLAGQTATINADTSGDPLREYQIAQAAPNKTAGLQEAYVSTLQKKIDAADQALRESFEESPFTASLNAEAGAMEYEQIAKEANSPIAVETEVVSTFESIESPFDFESRARREAALKLAMSNDLADMAENNGWGEAMWDFARMLVPFTWTKDADDIVKAAAAGGLTGAEDLQTFMLDYQSWEIERREMYWPQLKEMIVKYTDDNSLRARQFLMQFMNPNASDDVAFETKMDLFVSTFDVATLGIVRKTFSTVLSATARQANLAKLAKEVGNSEKAADLNIATLMDESGQVGDGVGLSKQQAYNNASPIAHDEALDPSTIEGLSEESERQLRAVQDAVEAQKAQFSANNTRLTEDFFKDEELQVQINDALDGLRKSADSDEYLIEEGVYMDNLKVIKVRGEDFDLSYDLISPDGTVEKAVETVSWNFSKTGDFIETYKNVDPAKEFFTSPSFFARAAAADSKIGVDFINAFESASRLDDLTAQAAKNMSDLLNQALKPVAGLTKIKARRRVNQALMSGDEHQRVYTKDELYNGITKDGVTLGVRLRTGPELEAYYGAKLVGDAFWSLQNSGVRRQLIIQGAKEVPIQGRITIGKPFARLSDARASIGGNKNVRILDTATDTMVDVDLADLDAAYEKGFVLVKHRDPDQLILDTKGASVDEFTQYSLVDASKVNDLPEVVTHYRVGYIPKINTKVEWIVKERLTQGMLDGKPGAGAAFRTLRFTSNKKDAEAMVAKAIDDAVAKGMDPEKAAARFEAIPDKGLTPDQRLDEALGSSGGLYHKPRATHKIYYGTGDATPDRISPLEALQRNASYLGRFMTRNEWRLGEEQRWLNTVRSVMPKLKVTNFKDTMETLGTGPEANKLKILGRTIERWNNTPAKDESLWSAQVQRLHDVALHTGRFVGIKADSAPLILWLKHKDPAAAAKAAVFHSFLGMGNPVQLYVQSQAAVVAMARFPKEAPAAIIDAFKMGILDNVKDSSALGKIVGGMDDSKMTKEIHKAWKSTGLADSVRVNSDLSAAENGIGMSGAALSRVLETGLLPFRVGELFNRRTSFAISYRNWKRLNPGKKPTDAQLKSIISETKVSMLELNKANSARFQGGPDATFIENITGVITQFGQVATKTTELALGDRLTGWQKVRIASSQATLFGLAGVPLGSALGNWAGQVAGEDARIDPAWANFYNQGAIGLITREALGAEIEIASRASLASGTLDFYVSFLTGDHPVETAAAASLFRTVSTTLGDNIYPTLSEGFRQRSLSKEDSIFVATELATMFSSTGRNFLKGMIMAKENRFQDTKGREVSLGTPTMATAIAQAIGFRATRDVYVREDQMSNKNWEELVTEEADIIFKILHKRMVLGIMDANTYENLMTFLTQHTDEVVAQKVRDQLRERLTGDRSDTLEVRELRKRMKRIALQTDGELAESKFSTFLQALTSQKAFVPIQR